MPNPKEHPAHFEVENAVDAMRKLEGFGRRILAVPKKETEKMKHAVAGARSTASKRKKR